MAIGRDAVRMVRFLRPEAASCSAREEVVVPLSKSTEDPSGIRERAAAATVVDTTGCGDAFMGVLLGSLAGREREEMSFMRRDELEEILYRANVAGALCAQRYGSCMIMPDSRAIEERIEGEKPWKK